MAYEVTATRKRPQDFNKLVGQEFVVSTLENAIKEGRIAHAYLFSGPRGVGKTSSARLLAKALNCESGPSAHPCGDCTSCNEITSGNSVDVIEIDGASNTSVNDIRAIKEEVLFPPQSSRYKIYIIDEVHMLSTSAFNALLKTIEEPPEYIIFIFATTELQKVPATIRSRCQQFRFQLISQNLIRDCLKSAAEDLDIKADEDALFWIAKEATGSMRDAYTLFDQVAAFSGNHITLEKIRTRLNLAGFSKINEIVSASLSGDSAGAMDVLSELFDSGVSAEQIIKDSADFFRTLLLYKNGVRRADLLSTAEDDIPKDIVEALSKEQLEAALKSLINLYRDIRYTISPRFEIELLFSRLSSLPYLTSSEILVKKLESMRQGIAEGNIVIKKKPQLTVIERAAKEDNVKPEDSFQEEMKDQDIPSCYAEEEKKETPLIDMTMIPRLISELRNLNRPEAARHLPSVVDIIDDGAHNLTFKMQRNLAFNGVSGCIKDVERALLEITGEKYRVSCVLDIPKIDEREPSERMQKLKNLLGGTIIFHEDAGRGREDKKENSNDVQLQSIRADEENGDYRSPDEDD